MPTPKETMEVLNDLIKINNHWIAGYEHALKELKIADADLKVLSQLMMEKGQHDGIYDRIEEEKSIGNKKLHPSLSTIIINSWIHFITMVSLRGRSFLSKAARKVYRKSIASENLPADLKEMIENQKFILKSTQDEIKAFRDMKS